MMPSLSSGLLFPPAEKNTFINDCYFKCWCVYPLLIPSDDIIEAVGFKSGSSTPQRSGSTAGLHRPRLSIDSASPAIDLPQLSSSLPGSLSGSSPMLTPRQGSHTMDFFEMCASLITTLARWVPLSHKPGYNLNASVVFRLVTDLCCWECRRLDWCPLSVSSLIFIPALWHWKGEQKCGEQWLSPQMKGGI